MMKLGYIGHWIKVKWRKFATHKIQLHVSIPLKLAQRSRSSEGECHLMWGPYELQMTKMSTYFKCYCDLCVTQTVGFRLKNILVLFFFCTFKPRLWPVIVKCDWMLEMNQTVTAGSLWTEHVHFDRLRLTLKKYLY